MPKVTSEQYLPDKVKAERSVGQNSNFDSISVNVHANEGYHRRLIPRVDVSVDELTENFNEKEWLKKTYGENVIIINDDPEWEIPEGWVLIDGASQ